MRANPRNEAPLGKLGLWRVRAVARRRPGRKAVWAGKEWVASGWRGVVGWEA